MSTKGKGTKKRVSKKENAKAPQSPSREFALKVLRGVSRENGFYFYNSLGSPTGAVACNLGEFCESVESLPTETIQFHLARGDFENWINFLGDDVLVRQISVLRSENLPAEELRRAFVSTVQERQTQLQKLA